MATRNCPNHKKCGGELVFTWERGDNGDSTTPYFESFDFAVLSKQTCLCELTDSYVERVEQEVSQDDYPDDDWEVPE